MNLCLCLLMNNPAKIQDNYEKISQKFRANNELINTENISDICELRDRVCSSGSKYEKIVVVVINTEFNEIEVSQAIYDIAGALGVSQSITICDTPDGTLALSLSHAMTEYPDTIIYSNLEKKTPTAIYNAVFGVKKRSVSKETETEFNNIKKSKKNNETDAEDAIPVIEESNDIPMPVLMEEEEDNNQKKKFGFKNIFKRKGRAQSNNEEPVPEIEEEIIPELEEESLPELEEDNVPELEEEPAPVSEPSNKRGFFRRKSKNIEEPVSVPEIEEVEESVPVPEIEESDEEEFESIPVPEIEEDEDDIPVFTDDMFTTSSQSFNEDDEEDCIMPEPIEPVSNRKKKKAPEPTIEEIEEDNTQSDKKKKKRKFGKSSAPKVDKSGLSMQTRPRIVYVTGTGRIGQSTIAASLGFTAAQYYCKSLIVDMDMIRRAISCIYQDYTNPNSMHAMGLVSAIRSPHLVDEIANEHYDNVSTLGISINAEDNREIMNSVSAEAVQSLLLQALTMYNLVVVDMPWDYLIANPVLMTVPHDILFTTSNDIMTMISDLNQLTPDSFDRPETFHMLISKMRFVLNMTSSENVYERKTITEKNFNKVCYILTEEDMFTTIPVIANIPIIHGVGNQASYGKPASSYSEDFAAHCAAILHELK